MKNDLIKRLYACSYLHAECADKWTARGCAEKHDMHQVHIATIQEAIEELLKHAKSPKPKPKSVAIPTKEEAVAYAAEINLPKREAERFYDHFESNGWKVSGRAVMKSWKAAVRNWCRNWEERNPEQARARKAESTKGADPAGWEDWMLFKNLPVKPYAAASGWMKTEFRAWVTGPQS